jgi:hypothetical protein
VINGTEKLWFIHEEIIEKRKERMKKGKKKEKSQKIQQKEKTRTVDK